MSKLNKNYMKQRLRAFEYINEYTMSTSQDNICEFLNTGKLDINKGYNFDSEEFKNE